MVGAGVSQHGLESEWEPKTVSINNIRRPDSQDMGRNNVSISIGHSSEEGLLLSSLSLNMKTNNQ